MKNFNCFPKQFFFQNDFIDTKNAVLRGRPNFSCSITGIDLKKSRQKMQKLFKSLFFKMFLWRSRKQLESLADFFQQPAELFPIDIQKITVCEFSKRFSPETFYWNWESICDNSATFLRKLVKKIAVSKNEKTLETKSFFVKMIPWTRRMQFQHPVENTTRSRNFPAHCLKMTRNINCFPKQFFFSNWFYR